VAGGEQRRLVDRRQLVAGRAGRPARAPRRGRVRHPGP
jgi:hypothetical protein